MHGEKTAGSNSSSDRGKRRHVMKKMWVLFAAVLTMFASSTVWAAGVPELINYQSLLYDDGGSLIPDGEISIKFRITDIEGTVLYEETQTTNVIGGAVSAMIGNGLDENGAPTGGLSMSVLVPGESRYLEVEVGDYPPQGAMEIVSVPYAMYAEEAMSISAGSLTINDFSEQLIQDLETELSESEVIATWNDLGQADGASGVGVQSGFIYSTSSDTQSVLQDLDTAISERDTRIDSVESSISQETTNRQSADQLLQQKIDEKVSKTGDDISGTVNLCGDLNVNCGGGLQVGGTDLPQAITQNQTDISINRGYFGGLKIIAWGSVAANGTLLYGYNVSVSKNQIAVYDIDFTNQPADANYLVLATCQEGGVGSCYAYVTGKTIGQFKVKTASNSPSQERPFDFVVFDLQ
jgi:hypothetical protein